MAVAVVRMLEVASCCALGDVNLFHEEPSFLPEKHNGRAPSFSSLDFQALHGLARGFSPRARDKAKGYGCFSLTMNSGVFNLCVMLSHRVLPLGARERV